MEIILQQKMMNGGSNGSRTAIGGGGGGEEEEVDIEKQGGDSTVVPQPAEEGARSLPQDAANHGHGALLTIVVSNGETSGKGEPAGELSKAAESNEEGVVDVASPRKDYLSRTSSSSYEQCRVCQQEKEEVLIDLGCQCRGGLAKTHRSCIETWFRTRGSNKCEICQVVASNVSPPESQPTANYWVWRVDPNFRGFTVSQERERGCFSPLWVAFLILIGGLLLDVLISITLGVSALPVNIIIGVIVVLGLGTAIRLALEFCHEWSLRRVVQRVETNVNLGYHPAL